MNADRTMNSLVALAVLAIVALIFIGMTGCSWTEHSPAPVTHATTWTPPKTGAWVDAGSGGGPPIQLVVRFTMADGSYCDGVDRDGKRVGLWCYPAPAEGLVRTIPPDVGTLIMNSSPLLVAPAFKSCRLNSYLRGDGSCSIPAPAKKPKKAVNGQGSMGIGTLNQCPPGATCPGLSYWTPLGIVCHGPACSDLHPDPTQPAYPHCSETSGLPCTTPALKPMPPIEDHCASGVCTEDAIQGVK